MSDHIKIHKAEGTWVIRAGGAVLGETSNALELIEGRHPPVIYFPRDDIAMAFLEASQTRAANPYIGEAHHFSIQTKSKVLVDAAWSYETPREDFAAIAGHIAFAPELATVERI